MIDIQGKIRLWQERIASSQYKKRDVDMTDIHKLHKIITFLGGRRTGKTSLMIHTLKNYVERNIVALEDVIFLDFSEKDNLTIDLQEIFMEYHAQNKKPRFVLDEIQEVPDFESVVLFLFNQWCKVFLTWSNAHLLSKDIATILRWRTYDIYVPVLSYNEYLFFSSENNQKQSLDEYIKRGWYPEIVSVSSEEMKKNIATSYIEILLYRDLVDRYNIRNEAVLYVILKSIIRSQTKNLTVSKLTNGLKSAWFTVSKNTVHEYIQYIKDCFFISEIWQLYQKSYYKKYYLIDNCYMNIYSRKDNMWQKFENIVYQYLKKKYNQLGYISNGHEIDFSDGETYRQVCYDLHEGNIAKETAFAKKEKKNILITPYPVQYNIPHIQCVSFEELIWMR